MSGSDNKRVAKNTLILYIRMFITMGIGMWTSRLVLNGLGFTDQGVYNVVAGFVGFSGLITASLMGSISRFITFSIGTGNVEEVNKAICNSVTIQWILAGILMLFGESLGLWFVNNKLVIPADRMFAANIAYQLALINIAVGIISSTQNAIILAYEKMGLYAKVAIINSILSFCIGWIIYYSNVDNLILYSSLQCLIVIGIRVFYIYYIHHTFSFIRIRYAFNREIFKPIFAFAGWNSIGSCASVLRNSGTSVLLNVFGGPLANTINGIANSANSLATIFIRDFTTAYNPQIIKKYAKKEFEDLNIFLYRCSKFTFCLLAIIAVPVIVNAGPLLTLWLKKIPEGTIIFARLIILCSMVDSFSQPLITAKNATGNIRTYQLVVGGACLLALPLSYLFLKLGLPIYFAYIGIMVSCICAFLCRMYMLNGDLPLWNSIQYLRKVIIPCTIMFILGLGIQMSLNLVLPHSNFYIILQCVIGVCACTSLVYFFVCSKNERTYINSVIKSKLNLRINGF